ncbi:MAG: DNA double-strand break repair nuclease NurA [Anaerolineales bacterium]|nr:DNA double-strand break repair nuclease NurA [Anaerolineales bacterium]
MPLNYQQVREQVSRLGENALERQKNLEDLRAQANLLLDQNANNLDALRQKVQDVARLDPGLRCALPATEALNAQIPLPGLPKQATIVAADGSQIFTDRHAEVAYGLINVGAVQMLHGVSPGIAEAPYTTVTSKLFYDEALENLTDATLALRRDLNERKLLVELADQAQPPVITFTDGPMELWGSKTEGAEAASEFQHSLEEYLSVLKGLCAREVITAGYVDKPGADLVVRLLEIARALPQEMESLRKNRYFRGVRDIDLLEQRLEPGERSAVFALQAQSMNSYQGALALYFCYLNVGRPGHPYLARLEIPAWVAENPARLEPLQAILVSQCAIMGARPYPYLLHRAHETAVVSHQEQEQVTQMIVGELLRRGVPVRGRSHKQAHKDLSGRKRHTL